MSLDSLIFTNFSLKTVRPDVILSSSKDLERYEKQVMINLGKNPIFKIVLHLIYSKINLALRNFNNFMLYSEF